MNSPAEERLRRMLDEGKLTPQECEELRAAIAEAESGKSAAGAPSGEAAVDWERMLRAYLDARRAERVPGYPYRERILFPSIAICGMVAIAGVVIDRPLLWGCGLVGMIIVAYFVRFGKIKNTR